MSLEVIHSFIPAVRPAARIFEVFLGRQEIKCGSVELECVSGHKNLIGLHYPFIARP